jgi:hypothetical protein
VPPVQPSWNIKNVNHTQARDRHELRPIPCEPRDAKVLSPITINGAPYRVLRLSRTAFEPHFPLRDDAGRIAS